MPALILHGGDDDVVAPLNALHLARQFLLFNGSDPAALRPLELRNNSYYVGRRLAAKLVLIPGLGHAWSGGDPQYRFFDGAHVEATRLVCDFFASH